MGINVISIISVPDNLEIITSTIKQSLQNADIIIATGGLGPTDDDLTRDAVSEALSLPLQKNEEEEERVKSLFTKWKIPYSDDNIRQAYFPKDSEILFNKKGTASGFKINKDNKLLFFTPGVPKEAKYLFDEFIFNEIKDKFSIDYTKLVIKTHNISEAKLNEEFRKLEISQSVEWGTLAKDDGIHLYVIVKGESSENKINEIKIELIKKFGDFIWGYNNEVLPEIIAALLKQNNFSLCTAESCTGGLIGKLITDIPGSSSYFKGGAVVYDNSIKTSLLNVDDEIIKKYGAVSQETVSQMAINAKQIFNTDCSIAVSGIAGPGGGSKEKPVGLVWMAASTPYSTLTLSRIFPGDRDTVRTRAAYYALTLLKKALIEKKQD
jgi:nicotinamide-nucleotide amidase